MSIRRDPLLRWMVVVPILIALPARWGLPTLTVRIGELTRADLIVYYPMIMSYALLILAPLMSGMVVGFLLLDQRDDRTLMALQISPLPLNSYLAYRLAGPMLVSAAVTLVALPLAGVGQTGLVSLLIASLAAAPLAPIVALALGAFAANKVQGFALTKLSGVFLIAPLLAYLVPPEWQLAFGIVPTYWPARVYWMLSAGEPGFWMYLLAGMAYQVLLLVLLLRRFNCVVSR